MHVYQRHTQSGLSIARAAGYADQDPTHWIKGVIGCTIVADHMSISDQGSNVNAQTK